MGEFIVLPNHLHSIVKVRRNGVAEIPPATRQAQRADLLARPGPTGTLTHSLGRVLQAFKSLTTVKYARHVREESWMPFPGRLWQRNYHESILRDAEALRVVARYIRDNPRAWDTDDENPQRAGNP